VAENGDGGGFGTASPYDWLSACTVVNNRAGQNGGGCFGGTLYDCLLTNNVAQYGGGYYLNYAEVSRLLYRCRVWDNHASGNGGGVYGGALYSSVLAGNSAGGTGGGAYGATLESCSVLGNVARVGAGGCYEGFAYNSIIYHNAADWGVDVFGTVCENCCTPEFGTVTSPPLISGFYEPHLLPESPCVDTGVNREWMFGEYDELDMDSEARVVGLSTDIGADESDADAFTGLLAIALHAESLSVTLGYALVLRAEVSGLPSSLLWEFGDGVTADNQNPVSHAFTEAGVYTVRATATNDTDTVFAELLVTVSAGDVFVALDGTHEWPFSTWLTAATNIQDAVEAAPWGATVRIGNGTYERGGRPAAGLALTNRVCIEKPVTVRSENGPEWVTVQGARHSAVEPFGAGAVRGVYLGHRAARLVGITVEGGATAAVGEMNGGGVYCAFAANSASNCVVANNLAFGEGGGVHGGSWLGCQMRNNHAANGGGACEAVLTGCELSDNEADYSGGGAQYSTVIGSSLVGNVATFGLGGGVFDCNAVRCAVSGNTAGAEGGGAAYGTLVSCLLAGNGALQAGGAAFASLNNCTVSANSATDDIGGAGWCNVVNSIVWDNAAPVETNVLWCVCSHSAVWPLPQGEYDLGGNLDAEPQFVNAPAGNYRLVATSPCINAGTNMPEVVGDADLDGRSRFVGGIVDMGAYEYAVVEGYAAMGTPIEWLSGYGLGPDYDAAELDDPDGDGFLTWEEYVALTDPTNGARFFAIRGVASTVSQVSVSFDTAVGRVYRVQHSEGLTPTVWTDVAAPVEGTGGRVTVAVPDSGGSFFYRVRVALP
jgi:PKD repeat protein